MGVLGIVAALRVVLITRIIIHLKNVLVRLKLYIDQYNNDFKSLDRPEHLSGSEFMSFNPTMPEYRQEKKFSFPGQMAIDNSMKMTNYSN